MHGPRAHLFDVLERLDERLEVNIHWSNPPRLSEWGRFVLRAYIFMGATLLLFPIFLLREIWRPCWLRRRWGAALLLLSLMVACISILLDFIASPWFKENIALPLSIDALALLLFATSLARKQVAEAGGQQ